MRFARLVKTTRWLSAAMLVGFVAVTHAGCELPPCPSGYEGPIDNRDGQVDPNSGYDYYCFKEVSWPPPPEPPELGKYANYITDTPGPRDRNGVAISSIFIESCIHDALTPELNINSRIDTFYNATMKSAVERAVSTRMTCLSNADSGQGCDRVRNCLGIAITPDEPSFTEGCTNATMMRRRVSPSGTVYNDWFFCIGLNVGNANLECYGGPSARCDTSREKCDASGVSSCSYDVPEICTYSAEEGQSFIYYAQPKCTQGTTCGFEGDTAFCTGTGPACSPTVTTPDETYEDFRAGIACEDATTLRACVNGHETLVDCPTLGQTFTCISGSRPHCGVDFQCDYDGKYPLPTCDGTKITVCNGGHPQTFDCKSLGFETCDPERGVCMNKPAAGK